MFEIVICDDDSACLEQTCQLVNDWIFYTTLAQRATAEKLIAELRAKGYDVATRVTAATTFWPAEEYHQDYYDRKGAQPYCHAYTKRF